MFVEFNTLTGECVSNLISENLPANREGFIWRECPEQFLTSSGNSFVEGVLKYNPSTQEISLLSLDTVKIDFYKNILIGDLYSETQRRIQCVEGIYLTRDKWFETCTNAQAEINSYLEKILIDKVEPTSEQTLLYNECKALLNRKTIYVEKYNTLKQIVLSLETLPELQAFNPADDSIWA